jgi:hypothetical protein
MMPFATVQARRGILRVEGGEWPVQVEIAQVVRLTDLRTSYEGMVWCSGAGAPSVEHTEGVLEVAGDSPLRLHVLLDHSRIEVGRYGESWQADFVSRGPPLATDPRC